MSEANPKVDFFFIKAKQWKAEFEKLREIALDYELDEELKWGVPCYTLEKRNVFLIHGFKEYCAILFHKGVLLKDLAGVLVSQTENTQATRQIRFTNIEEIEEMEHILKAYIHEAVEVEKASLKVPYKKTKEFNMPEEFQEKLDADPSLKAAFDGLTPGRQRAYLLYFSSAKQAKTRIARVEKYMPRIMKGKGLDD